MLLILIVSGERYLPTNEPSQNSTSVRHTGQARISQYVPNSAKLLVSTLERRLACDGFEDMRYSSALPFPVARGGNVSIRCLMSASDTG